MTYEVIKSLTVLAWRNQVNKQEMAWLLTKGVNMNRTSPETLKMVLQIAQMYLEKNRATMIGDDLALYSIMLTLVEAVAYLMEKDGLERSD